MMADMDRDRLRSKISGFTLVETLVATALMGVIVFALAVLTAQWLPNWNRGFDRVQRSDLLGLGLERLAADVAAAEFVSPSRGTSHPLFDGTELSVTFVRTALGPTALPGLEVVRVAETSDQRGLALVRERAPFFPVDPDAPLLNQFRFADPVVLVRAPYRISFSYAGPDRIWQPTWRDAGRLPNAIRIMVRDAGTQRALSVSTATLLHTTMSADCMDSSNSDSCGAPSSQGANATEKRAPNSGSRNP